MKKFILPTIVLILPILLLVLLPIHKVSAQDTEPIGCEELKKILGSDECPHYVIDRDLWCAQTEGELSGGFDPQNGIDQRYKNRPPDYVIDRSSDFFSEDTQKAAQCLDRPGNDEIIQSDQSQSDQSTRKGKQGQDTNPVQVINDWITDTFSDLDFEAIETERLYGRTPKMTEEIINQYKAEQKALYEGPDKSPYRLDIQKGDIAIKLPGQTEWSTLKQGDRIPPGSTIFTGMDSTTVLSIRGQGVIQVQSFTEITVTEKGLEEAAKTGQTYTDIELRTGEVELNLPSGIFTGSLQVHTPNFVAGVRGTHFWVSYDKNKDIATVGVYEGTVDVTVKGSDQSTLVSPNGDKPGVVMVTQKLSVTKLIFAGLGLLVITGGAVLFLKRKNKMTRPRKIR